MNILDATTTTPPSEAKIAARACIDEIAVGMQKVGDPLHLEKDEAHGIADAIAEAVVNATALKLSAEEEHKLLRISDVLLDYAPQERSWRAAYLEDVEWLLGLLRRAN